jgi:hypothetical protein
MIKKGKFIIIYRVYEPNITTLNFKKIRVYKRNKIFIGNTLKVTFV